jgi:FYVE/RhoGEF/PH domain-containing protein 5/6
MKLTLRDWLLTIVQRCPRYLLLLKDLIGCTAEDDLEYARLGDVYELVSKSTYLTSLSAADLTYSFIHK